MSAGLQGNKDSEEKTWLFTIIIFQCVKKHIYMHGWEKHNPDLLFTFLPVPDLQAQ